MKGWTKEDIERLKPLAERKVIKSLQFIRSNQKTFNFIIGIDPGVNTGIAVWDYNKKKLIEVATIPIHMAMELVIGYNTGNCTALVRFEDARQRKWFGNAGREQLQGAGSIKRDCGIWEDFLKHHKIPFEAVAPKNNKTKLSQVVFKKMTGWETRTNEHGRDAAMLVVNY